MPQGILLQQFGDYVRDAFGEVCYHVGSSLDKKDGWRDVDVRLILDDAKYQALGLGVDVKRTHHSRRWVAITLAWSAFGRQLTGLPIDFQIQARSAVTEDEWNKPRSALFTVYDDTSWRLETPVIALAGPEPSKEKP